MYTDGVATKYYTIAGMTVAMKDSAGVKYLLTDHLGSVEAVTDASGALLSQQRYLPALGRHRPRMVRCGLEARSHIGEVRTDQFAPGAVTETDFGYTGQRDVESLGLMDYKARFYDPALGRFTQPDTIVPNATVPQSWNRYAYVLNAPILLNDPTGRCPFCVVAVVLAGLAVSMSQIPSDTAHTDPAEQGDQGVFEAGLAIAGGSREIVALVAEGLMGVARLTENPRLFDAALRAQNAATSVGPYGAYGSSRMPSRGNTSQSETMTVRHYTDDWGKAAISESGSLKPGTYVTMPSEIPARAGHIQIEGALELQPGRGANYIDVQVPIPQLSIAENGPLTSGGLWQRRITNPLSIAGSGWRRPPGRPIAGY